MLEKYYFHKCVKESGLPLGAHDKYYFQQVCQTSTKY